MPVSLKVRFRKLAKELKNHGGPWGDLKYFSSGR